MGLSASSATCVTSVPSRRVRPPVGSRRCRIARPSVVLPLPEPPRVPNTSLRGMAGSCLSGRQGAAPARGEACATGPGTTGAGLSPPRGQPWHAVFEASWPLPAAPERRGAAAPGGGRASPLLHRFACSEHGEAPADLERHGEVVDHEQQRRAEARAHPRDEPQDLALDGDVERRGGLVGDSQRGSAAKVAAISTRWRILPRARGG